MSTSMFVPSANLPPPGPTCERDQPPFRLASRTPQRDRSTVLVGLSVHQQVEIGGGTPVIIAGPCSVESHDQTLSTALAVQAAGAHMLRGGAYKPRTSPYEFQGLGREALLILADVRRRTGMPVVTEVMSTDDAELVAQHADMLQVGARNMQNFSLLRCLAQIDRPILLKRGPSATVKEWLLAAEYLLAGGNSRVVLCERGSKSFDSAMRNTMDIGAIALAKELSHLPVLADPSHATGRRDLVGPVGRAALAAGADGLIVEVHPDPDRALSDGPQSLTFEGFRQFAATLGLQSSLQASKGAFVC